MSQAIHHHLVLPLDFPQPGFTVAEILALQLFGLRIAASISVVMIRAMLSLCIIL